MTYLASDLTSVEYGKQLPSATLNSNFSKITDAISAAYTDVISRLSKSGGTMTGPIDMNTNYIQRVKDAVDVTDAPNYGQILDAIAINSPIGEILYAGGPLNSSYYLNCDGSAVSRTTYADLFSVIGTLHGSGDGATTFNLPNCKGRAIIGSGLGSGLTNREVGQKGGTESVALTYENIPEGYYELVSYIGDATTGIAASSITAGYIVSLEGLGTAHNNMQPFTVEYAYIRYRNI